MSSVLNWICWTPPPLRTKFFGYATVPRIFQFLIHHLILQYRYTSHNLPRSISEPLSINVPYIDSVDVRTYSWDISHVKVSLVSSNYCNIWTCIPLLQAGHVLGHQTTMRWHPRQIWLYMERFCLFCLLLPHTANVAPVGLVQTRQTSFVSRSCESRIPKRLCVAEWQWRRHLMSKLNLLRDSSILKKKCHSLITIFLWFI